MTDSIIFRAIVNEDGPTVRYGKRRRIERKLKAYYVIRDGAVIGTVRERMETFEKKWTGHQAVLSRWQSPRWFAEMLGENPRYKFGRETRKAAANELLTRLDQHQASKLVTAQRMQAYVDELATDPKYQADQRAIRNKNRLNDMYAGVVLEPFHSKLEEWEFSRTYFPDSQDAKKPRPVDES